MALTTESGDPDALGCLSLGPVSAAKMNHHGHWSMPGKLVRALRPKIWLACVWDQLHTVPETLTRLSNRAAYGGRKDVLLAPGVFPEPRMTKEANKPYFKDVAPECRGTGCHVVLTVPPGGATGDFTASANWSPAQTPQPGDTLVINKTVTFDAATFDVGSEGLTVQSTAKVVNQVAFTGSGNITVRSNSAGYFQTASCPSHMGDWHIYGGVLSRRQRRLDQVRSLSSRVIPTLSFKLEEGGFRLAASRRPLRGRLHPSSRAGLAFGAHQARSSAEARFASRTMYASKLLTERSLVVKRVMVAETNTDAPKSFCDAPSGTGHRDMASSESSARELGRSAAAKAGAEVGWNRSSVEAGNDRGAKGSCNGEMKHYGLYRLAWADVRRARI